MSIEKNYERMCGEVAEVCESCGRASEDVLLLAVSKTVGLEGVTQAAEAGAHAFGENRPDQLMEKATAFPDLDWHFIGNIQSRRIGDIVDHAALIHSLYQEKHARKIDEMAAKIGKIQDVLLEVNVSGEESKSGAAPDEAEDLLTICLGLPHLRVRGLMAMAPQGDKATAQSTFKELADLKAHLAQTIADEEARQAFSELSMGMSEDWPEAIAEGSTIVRVGRAIFSDNFAD